VNIVVDMGDGMIDKLFVALWSLDASDKYFLNASSSIASALKMHGDTIRYVIATTKELTSFQKNIIHKLQNTYNESISILKLNKDDFMPFKIYTKTWPMIIFAKLLLCEQFRLPYLAIDADVLFFNKVDDISFLTSDKPIASICDISQIKRGKLNKLNKAFNCNIDVYLNAGALLISPNTLHLSDIYNFISRYGVNEAIKHPEQDMLAVIMQDKLQYYPESFGIQLFNDLGKNWKAKEIQNINEGKYKFAHLMTKQWNKNSPFYQLHLSYLNEIGLSAKGEYE